MNLSENMMTNTVICC